MILTEVTKFSLYGTWLRLSPSVHKLIIGILLFVVGYHIYSSGKNYSHYHFINNAHTEFEHPAELLKYSLIAPNAQLKLLDIKLSLLKSFSLLPIALLVLDNLSDTVFKDFDLFAFMKSDPLNAALIIAVFIYTFEVIHTYLKTKAITEIICTLEHALYRTEFPETLKEKTKSKGLDQFP